MKLKCALKGSINDTVSTEKLEFCDNMDQQDWILGDLKGKKVVRFEASFAVIARKN
jgi:hypothetical protein